MLRCVVLLCAAADYFVFFVHVVATGVRGGDARGGVACANRRLCHVQRAVSLGNSCGFKQYAFCVKHS